MNLAGVNGSDTSEREISLDFEEKKKKRGKILLRVDARTGYRSVERPKVERTPETRIRAHPHLIALSHTHRRPHVSSHCTIDTIPFTRYLRYAHPTTPHLPYASIIAVIEEEHKVLRLSQ